MITESYTRKELTIVSVVMITYKHEAFIAEAIEGVLMQELDFRLELIIADDCSPDCTEEIVQKYIDENTNFHCIKYTRHEKNIGMIPNFIWAISQCKGNYIALCEGDDFWTDKFKLQKQINYLENNTFSAGCFHHASLVDEKNQIMKTIYNEFVGGQSQYDQYRALTWLGSAYATSSLVFRQEVVLNLPIYAQKQLCDEVLDILITSCGTLDFINENMSVYRIHQGGVWSGVSENKRNIDFINRSLVLIEDPILRSKFFNFLANRISTLAQLISLNKTNKKKVRYNNFILALKYINYNRIGTYKYIFRYFLNPIFK